MAPAHRPVRALGRALLAAPFVVLGAEAVRDPAHRVALAEAIGMPAPRAAVQLNGAAMTAGGVALAAGVLPRAAAAGLAVSLVPTTVAGHAYWRMDEPGERKANRIHLLKNLGLLGGLLALAAAPGGR